MFLSERVFQIGLLRLLAHCPSAATPYGGKGWPPYAIRNEYRYLVDQFPELSDGQFMYLVMHWCRKCKPDQFRAMPSWDEVLRPLYRNEKGVPNRSWGFRPDLPEALRPTQEQLAMMPSVEASVLDHWPGVENINAHSRFREGGFGVVTPAVHELNAQLPPAEPKSATLLPPHLATTDDE